MSSAAFPAIAFIRAKFSGQHRKWISQQFMYCLEFSGKIELCGSETNYLISTGNVETNHLTWKEIILSDRGLLVIIGH